MARSAALASFSSRIATSRSPSHDQAAIAGRVGRPEAEHRDRLAAAPAARAAGRASAAGPAACRRTRPGCRRRRARARARAASTAWAVPRRSACTKISAPGSAAIAAAAHRVLSGPDHHGGRGRRYPALPPAHAPSGGARRSRAAPWGARRASASPRRPRARWSGRFWRSSEFRPRPNHPAVITWAARMEKTGAAERGHGAAGGGGFCRRMIPKLPARRRSGIARRFGQDHAQGQEDRA